MLLKGGRCSLICLRSQAEQIRVILLFRKEEAWTPMTNMNVSFRFVNVVS